MPEIVDDIETGGGGARNTGRRQTQEEADDAYREHTEEWKAHVASPWVAEGRAPQRSDFRKADHNDKWQEASRAYEEARTQYEAERFRRLQEGAPTVDDLSYDPETERSDFLLGESAAGQAAADLGSIEAQRRALGQMEEIYQQGGYTSAEREQIEQSMMQARNLERAGTEAARQQMAARGMVGAGAQVGAQMAAQQGAMNRGRGAATDIAVAGQRRALDALGAAGRTAGQMRGQSWEEAHGRGSAIDDFRAKDVDYQREHEQRRAEAETEARKHRTTAEQQTFENKWGLTRDEAEARHKGRELEQANKQRIDAVRQGKISAATGAIGSGLEFASSFIPVPKTGGDS